MPINILDLKSVIQNKGSLIIKSSDYNVLDLISLAKDAKTHGVKLTIKVTASYNALDIKSIAIAGGGCVTFEV